MPPDQRTLDHLSLTREEYDRIVDLLDREPNEVELGMFGALWSEHCGYKNSRPLLKMFPTEGAGVLTKTGEENAGVVDIGDGLCVAFKIESHNHPSAIEPYEGAATGVGGIVRDIFAMGARPVAILDSLRFGPLQPTEAPTPAPGVPLEAYLPPTDEETAARNRRLFSGVVAGIGGYGNCLGIPTVGGEVSFAPSYSGNPIVNAMCVGVAKIENLVKARADGPGNLLMLVGANTGRDGIHGATFASVELDESSEERRPAVQVGNPFLEKLLMEACLELTEQHKDWIVGLQDLGAAGLTSSSVECAAKAGTGIIIDVAKVPRREEGMTPYEVMLSESQERMLVIVKPQHEDDVRALFEHWELHCATIGVVTDDGIVRIRDGATEVAAVPAKLLTDAPTYVREGVKPHWLDAVQKFDFSTLPGLPIMMRPPRNFGDLPKMNGISDPEAWHERWETLAREAVLDLVASPEIASKRIVWRQYDHQVGTDTVVGPGCDAAVVRIKGTDKALAIATDGNAVYTHLDPYTGGAIAVCEAARNVACTGARPLAMTNCLNFGNPEKPEVYWQLSECIRGMADAAKALGIPVISGNVSLYNETNGEPIWPTPVVGVVGLIEDVDRVVSPGFQDVGDEFFVFLPSNAEYAETASLAGTQYVQAVLDATIGKPAVDLDAERRMLLFMRVAVEQGLVKSMHDISSGGALTAIAESCLAGDTGCYVMEDAERRLTAMFGEFRGVLMSTDLARSHQLSELARKFGFSAWCWGQVGGYPELNVGDYQRSIISIPLDELREAYESGLPRALGAAALNV
jgi:phosphoribosylformylglycinamidine synthase